MVYGDNVLFFSLDIPSSFLEEAVNEVKRQAMSELQKAVSDAERKAHEMISAERSKMERALAEAKRQASENALTVINQQEDSSEVSTACSQCSE